MLAHRRKLKQSSPSAELPELGCPAASVLNQGCKTQGSGGKALTLSCLQQKTSCRKSQFLIPERIWGFLWIWTWIKCMIEWSLELAEKNINRVKCVMGFFSFGFVLFFWFFFRMWLKFPSEVLHTSISLCEKAYPSHLHPYSNPNKQMVKLRIPYHPEN